MKITKKELAKLAQLIRDEKTGNNSQSILWAVNYHLPLVLWQIEKPVELVNALLVACFTGVEPSICGALGLERSISIGSPLLTCSTSYRSEGKLESADEQQTEL